MSKGCWQSTRAFNRETFLDEWNMSLSHPVRDPRFQPAYVAETAWQMFDAGLDYSCYYHIRDYYVDVNKFSEFMSHKGAAFMARWWNRMPQYDGLIRLSEYGAARLLLIQAAVALDGRPASVRIQRSRGTRLFHRRPHVHDAQPDAMELLAESGTRQHCCCRCSRASADAPGTAGCNRRRPTTKMPVCVRWTQSRSTRARSKPKWLLDRGVLRSGHLNRRGKWLQGH